MDNTQSPPVSFFLPAAIVLAVLGWGGIAALIYLAMPTVGPRWLFFFLGVLAVTGVALPIAAFLNRRFPSTPPATVGVITRQALWAGIYFPTLAWLQIPRVLTSSIALLLLVGVILIESLVRLREKSRWKP